MNESPSPDGRVGRLLSDPRSWCKRHFAINKLGQAVSPMDKSACSWCIGGAITKEYGSGGEATLRVVEYLRGRGIASFNDAKETTHEDVVLLCEETGI